MRTIILALLFLICCSPEINSQPGEANSQPKPEQSQPQSTPAPVNPRENEINQAAKAEREREEKAREAKEDLFREDQARQNRVISIATLVMAIVAVLNLIVAIVYAIYARRTLQAVERQANHASDQVKKMDATLEAMDREQGILQRQLGAMEQQTEYANRAYVCVRSGTIKVLEEIDTKKRVEVFWFRIENTGTTPANGVCVRSFSDIATEIPDPALLMEAKIGHEHQVGVIAPRSHTFYFVRSPRPTGEQVAQWIEGKIEVYCSGFITYESFGKMRTTKFCFLRRPGESGDFESYGKWSEAD